MNSAPNPIPCSTVTKSRNEISIAASFALGKLCCLIVACGAQSVLSKINGKPGAMLRAYVGTWDFGNLA